MFAAKWLLSAVVFRNRGVAQGPMVLQHEVFGDSPSGKVPSRVPAQKCMKRTFDTEFVFCFCGTVLVVRRLKACLP